jgi:DNA modification methylase
MSDPLTLIHGDALSSLRTLESESVQTCVTSPPYWGLRDYGTGKWEGGDPDCGHTSIRKSPESDRKNKQGTNAGSSRDPIRGGCRLCGASRVDIQIGLEKTPDKYAVRLVEIFRELKRVLRNDGTLWLNLGDSYAAARSYQVAQTRDAGSKRALASDFNDMSMSVPPGLKQKDLVGIPWMIAFALRADGWYLRSDIIWSKPNPMPESVTDRPTKSHEYIFLLSKSERYFYDADAIAEPVLRSSLIRAEAGVKFGGNNLCPDTRLQSGNEWKPKAAREYGGKTRAIDPQANARRILKNMKAARDAGGDHDAPFGVTRNKRTVWTVATAPFQDAHFATFPPDLIVPCILAGAEAGGVVLDPFAGSGTTAKVAIELGRKAIAIEPKAEYVEMIKRRCQTTIGLPLQSATA